MTMTRDVILDLLPLYFAGQVSADTRKLWTSSWRPIRISRACRSGSTRC